MTGPLRLVERGSAAHVARYHGRIAGSCVSRASGRPAQLCIEGQCRFQSRADVGKPRVLEPSHVEISLLDRLLRPSQEYVGRGLQDPLTDYHALAVIACSDAPADGASTDCCASLICSSNGDPLRFVAEKTT